MWSGLWLRMSLAKLRTPSKRQKIFLEVRHLPPRFLSRRLLRLRHKMRKPSNSAASERLKDRLFLPEIAASAGLSSVCDAVVVAAIEESHRRRAFPPR